MVVFEKVAVAVAKSFRVANYGGSTAPGCATKDGFSFVGGSFMVVVIRRIDFVIFVLIIRLKQGNIFKQMRF